MRKDNFITMRRKPFAPATSEGPYRFLIVPDLVRDLVRSAPDQIWIETVQTQLIRGLDPADVAKWERRCHISGKTGSRSFEARAATT